MDRRWIFAALVLGALGLAAWLARAPSVAPLQPGAVASSAPAKPTAASVGDSPSPVVAASTSGSANAPSNNSKTKEVASFAWGSGKGELGRIERKEGNAEGPMSLVVDKDGTTWVLDQVNGRLVRVDKNGKPLEPIALSLKAPQDLAIGKDGTVAVLDRLVDKQVALYGPDGKPVGSLTLEGKGIEEGGAVSGVFVDGKKVYVEREHETVLRLGGTDGKADPTRDEVPGRPTRDGSSWIRAWMGEVPGQRVFVAARARDTEANRFTRQINATMVLTGIVLLDTDLAGTIYVGTLGSAVDDKGQTTGEPQIVLYCLEPLHGAVIGTTSAPASLDPHETFRELAVADEGGVLYLHRDAKGGKLLRLDCRPTP
ncbi:MAG: hypothetical protein IPJ34_17130 [Myxococcales bacterium]|nr:hypothetical protein [Myxococcales bacterium]